MIHSFRSHIRILTHREIITLLSSAISFRAAGGDLARVVTSHIESPFFRAQPQFLPLPPHMILPAIQKHLKISHAIKTVQHILCASVSSLQSVPSVLRRPSNNLTIHRFISTRHILLGFSIYLQNCTRSITALPKPFSSSAQSQF